MSETIKVGAVQAEPAWLNLPESVKKVTSLVEQAGKDGVNVLGFPELFVPGYPWFLDNTGMFHECMANSLVKDSPEMPQICEAVKKAGIFIVLGYSERDGDSLYIAQSFINPEGKIILHRRKIKPTGVEHAIWGDGDGLINVVDSPFGKIGGWPPFFGRPENIPILYTTTGEGDRLACQFMAMEGACFVVVSTQVMGEKGREKLKLVGSPHVTSGGGFAMIFGPDGTPLVDPLDPGEEGILTAEIQLSTIDYAKNMLDVVGHYSRPDLLSLNINLKGAKPVRYV
ncbi:hypothetical protein M431DRAFT_501016 [Trichoderma harzianum CBS 226.95]|uniref:nitrilase n=1 Tax=Trichoderma harzianum CBS 226.95 TaxID=983964 RepID=A0A2T3ZUR9_TRIHA|nr:hypothetical protein M431DRAFT_501016 [Trichoderma harzianum CBS 226.95]PTB48556.1 hypothetical protein M431DRAFT_501016 [Trichoderma harzianum CBS 226.95]